MKYSNILTDHQEKKALYNKIETLEHNLKVALDNADYYRELLKETRAKILVIKALTGAKTEIPDRETVNQAWARNINAIIEELQC